MDRLVSNENNIISCSPGEEKGDLLTSSNPQNSDVNIVRQQLWGAFYWLYYCIG